MIQSRLAAEAGDEFRTEQSFTYKAPGMETEWWDCIMITGTSALGV